MNYKTANSSFLKFRCIEKTMKMLLSDSVNIKDSDGYCGVKRIFRQSGMGCSNGPVHGMVY